MVIEIAVGVLTSVIVPTVGWAANTHSRVNVIDQKTKDQEKLIQVQLVSIDSRLDRIERALNGAWKRAGSNVEN